MTRPSVPAWLNHTVKSLLRSPFHGVVSKTIMLISFNGRKTGKHYTTPIRYIQDEGYIVAFTAERWAKNLQGGVPVSLQLQGKAVRGIAETIEDDLDTIASGLGRLLRIAPGDAKYLEIALDADGMPVSDDVQRAAKSTTMIRVRI